MRSKGKSSEMMQKGNKKLPFTNAEEVEEYMLSPVPDIATKQKRMKKEIQFARNSSTTLPKFDPLFKVQVTKFGQTKKRRDKTA